VHILPVSAVGVNISKTGNYTILITVSISFLAFFFSNLALIQIPIPKIAPAETPFFTADMHSTNQSKYKGLLLVKKNNIATPNLAKNMVIDITKDQ
ncbi:hypothetical protein, partial [Dickeya chrysanthemi]|uniref:hypothetical protein n=1 Tax=Dickeya chrysanthemi TaxID=556 RepID=UPI001C8D586B